MSNNLLLKQSESEMQNQNSNINTNTLTGQTSDYIKNLEDLLQNNNVSPTINQSNSKPSFYNNQNTQQDYNDSRMNTDINFCTTICNNQGDQKQLIMPSINIVNEHTNINIYNQNSSENQNNPREQSSSLKVPNKNQVFPQNRQQSGIQGSYSPRSPGPRQSFRVPEALRIRSLNIKKELKKINESEASLADSFSKKNKLAIQNNMFSFNNINPYQSVLSPKSTAKLRKILDKVKMRCNGATFLKYTSQKYRFRTFTQQIVQFFNDKSFFSHINNTNSSYFSLICSKFNFSKKKQQYMYQKQNDQEEDSNDFLSCIPVFKPTGTFKNIWNFLQLCIIMFGFIYIPLIFGFGMDNLYGTQYFQIAILCIFLIDCVVCLNTGVYVKGHLKMDRKSILNWYYNHRLLIDILSNIPLFVSLYTEGNKESLTNNISIFLYFLKFSEFTYVRRQFYETFHISKQKRYAIELIQLVCIILVFSHVYACILIKVNYYEQALDQESWTSKVETIDLNKDGGYNVYIYAFYFATVTMCSVGYGDISPVNQLEIIIGTLFMIVACVLFAYFISKIGSILNQLQIESNKTNEMVNLLQIYMNKKNISNSLQQHLREYIEFYYSDHLDDLSKFEIKFKGILSKSLKQDLLVENYAMVTQHPIFKNNFSQQTRNNLIKEIKELKVIPEQLLYSGNSKSFQNTQTLFFVEEGELEIYIQEDDHHQQIFTNNKQLRSLQQQSHPIKILKKGDFFGGILFFTGQDQYCNYKVKSKSFGSVLTIDQENFLNLIENKPKELETFHRIKDKLIYSEQFHLVNNKCFACNVETHTCTFCPYVNIRVNRNRIINNCNKSSYQDRKYIQRQQKNFIRKVNTRNEIQIIKERCQDYLLENIQQLEKIQWVQKLDQFSESFFNFSTDSEDQDQLQLSQDTNNNQNNNQLNSIPEIVSQNEINGKQTKLKSFKEIQEKVSIRRQSKHHPSIKLNQEKSKNDNNSQNEIDSKNKEEENQKITSLNVINEDQIITESQKIITNNNDGIKFQRKKQKHTTVGSEKFTHLIQKKENLTNNNLSFTDSKQSAKKQNNSLFWQIKSSKNNTPTNNEQNYDLDQDFQIYLDQKNHFFTISDFEQMKEYTMYYPKFNYTHILFQFKMFQKFKQGLNKISNFKFGKKQQRKRLDSKSKFKPMNSLSVSQNNLQPYLQKSNNSFNYNDENQISVIE